MSQGKLRCTKFVNRKYKEIRKTINTSLAEIDLFQAGGSCGYCCVKGFPSPINLNQTVVDEKKGFQYKFGISEDLVGRMDAYYKEEVFGVIRTVSDVEPNLKLGDLPDEKLRQIALLPRALVFFEIGKPTLR